LIILAIVKAPPCPHRDWNCSHGIAKIRIRDYRRRHGSCGILQHPYFLFNTLPYGSPSPQVAVAGTVEKRQHAFDSLFISEVSCLTDWVKVVYVELRRHHARTDMNRLSDVGLSDVSEMKKGAGEGWSCRFWLKACELFVYLNQRFRSYQFEEQQVLSSQTFHQCK